MTETVGSKLLREMVRVAELRGRYLASGPGGVPAAAMMTTAIEEAQEAILGDDPARCIRALQALEAFEE